jgi:hypothetical protein
VQSLALWPFCEAPELQPLMEALSQALPGLIRCCDPSDPAGDGVAADQPLLLPYLPPHRLLACWGESPAQLEQAWSAYAALVKRWQDLERTVPALPVHLEFCSPPSLVAWLVNPEADRPPNPSAPDLDPLASVDPLLAQLTLQFLAEQPPVLEAYGQLDGAYATALQARCTPELLLAAMAERRLQALDLAEEQQRLEQQRADLAHVLDDRDLLSRQLNELNAGFEAFYDQANSDAGKLDWNRRRRAELELTLQLQQRELEALARQVKEQAALIQRSAAASEQMMQLMAAALAD